MLSLELVENISLGVGGVVVNFRSIYQNMNQVITAGGTFDVGKFLAMLFRDFSHPNSPRSVA
jgi:hypothetical protein